MYEDDETYSQSGWDLHNRARPSCSRYPQSSYQLIKLENHQNKYIYPMKLSDEIKRYDDIGGIPAKIQRELVLKRAITKSQVLMKCKTLDEVRAGMDQTRNLLQLILAIKWIHNNRDIWKKTTSNSSAKAEFTSGPFCNANHGLGFTLWLAHFCRVIDLSSQVDAPFISNYENNNLRDLGPGIQPRRITVAVTDAWHAFGCPPIQGVDTRCLLQHSLEKSALKSTGFPHKIRAVNSEFDAVSAITLLQQCLCEYFVPTNLLVKSAGVQLQVHNETLISHCIIAMMREKATDKHLFNHISQIGERLWRPISIEYHFMSTGWWYANSIACRELESQLVCCYDLPPHDTQRVIYDAEIVAWVSQRRAVYWKKSRTKPIIERCRAFTQLNLPLSRSPPETNALVTSALPDQGEKTEVSEFSGHKSSGGQTVTLSANFWVPANTPVTVAIDVVDIS